MSQADVEMVQQGFVVWGETGEPPWSTMADELEIHDHDLMDTDVYRGHEGFRRWVENWSSAFSEFSIDPVEFIDAGERVVVILRMTAKGTGSGVTVEREDAEVLEVRDGIVVRVDYYNNRRQALESVGLAE
jgi:ketosteroid isomerase-like protein